MSGFFYLATPYSKYHLGREAAYQHAVKIAARLIQQGVPVFSPIAHSHPLAEIGKLPATDHEFWMKVDKPMLDASMGVIVAQLVGWSESAGVRHEIAEARQQEKPVLSLWVLPEWLE